MSDRNLPTRIVEIETSFASTSFTELSLNPNGDYSRSNRSSTRRESGIYTIYGSTNIAFDYDLVPNAPPASPISNTSNTSISSIGKIFSAKLSPY